MDKQIEKILDRAKQLIRASLFQKSTGSDVVAIAITEGKVYGLLEAARLLTVRVDDPIDGTFASDSFTWDFEGIYRNNVKVREIKEVK